MRTILLGMAAVALLGSACGGTADDEAGGGGDRANGGAEAAASGPPTQCLDVSGEPMVEIRSVHNDFTPECLVVSEDQRIRVVNEDLVRHSFTVSEEVVYRTPFLLDIDEIEGGKNATTDVVGTFLDAEGGNPYFCKYHAGMEGELWLAA
jgi:plastocyanin